jgi:hypothetical protein
MKGYKLAFLVINKVRMPLKWGLSGRNFPLKLCRRLVIKDSI